MTQEMLMQSPWPKDDRGARKEAATLFAILLGLTVLSILMLIWQTVDPAPIQFGGITIDRLSSSLALLVAGIGTVTFRFSVGYLDGNPMRRRFLRLLSFTVLAAYLLMCSTHLLLFFASWLVTSVGLHKLLTIYPHRRESLRPARKKFLISRLGDLALLSAIYLIWKEWGTLDLNEFLAAIVVSNASSSLDPIAFLVVIAALTKSAQFPFHSWLPETMESPTPVSALMHAGIINAGGALLIRFAPVIVRVPEVLLLLSIIGTLTFAIGMLAMWAQVKVKRTLAWSTVSQMGFMMVQCGLAAFPAAAIHIIGHGCYKAWNFLRSGDLPPIGVAPTTPIRALMLLLIGTISAIPIFALASWVTGYSPLHSPGELALSAIVAISVGQLWVAILGRPVFNWTDCITNSIIALASTVCLAMGSFALYRGAARFLLPVLGDLPPTNGLIAWISAVIPIIMLLMLSIIHAFLPVITRAPLGRSLHVHALHGFYFGAIADRLVDSVWRLPRTLESGENHE
jgi:NADH:ubiquinone oxidoreductase subunit 5 (subunit L)/multisubunit Na+/H+ antiporter MnhA subunit